MQIGPALAARAVESMSACRGEANGRRLLASVTQAPLSS